jgi:hypothetical protein
LLVDTLFELFEMLLSLRKVMSGGRPTEGR